MLSQTEFINAYGNAGAKKAASPALRLFLLGILAGFEIACGGALSTIASFSAGSASIVKTLASFTFPLALTMVIWTGAELFTGNCLIIVPVLSGKAKLSGMLRNWLLVYLGNMVGGFIIAAIATFSHIYSFDNGNLATMVVSTAVTKANISFGDGFLRGILCNVLVCLAVWCSFAADELAGKVLALWLPVMLFIICGFEHCVANMYFIPAGLLTSAFYGVPADGLSLFGFFVTNLIPVTLGNIIGGSLCVGAAYYVAYLKD